MRSGAAALFAIDSKPIVHTFFLEIAPNCCFTDYDKLKCCRFPDLWLWRQDIFTDCASRCNPNNILMIYMSKEKCAFMVSPLASTKSVKNSKSAALSAVNWWMHSYSLVST